MTDRDDQKKIIGGRVLFVDDEINILKAMRRLFMDDAFEVFIANSGKEALQILEKEGEMGVIVSDQRMPEMTGVDFLEKSKKIAPHSVRILLTGYADINAAVDAINRGGAWRYLHKPWQDAELLQTVQDAFKYYNLVKENKRLTLLVLKQNEKLKNWTKELETVVQEQTMELSNKNDSLKRLNDALYQNFKNTILAFSSLLEMRDKSMRSHSRNIAELVRPVAVELEMASKEIDTLIAAAFLHDIGKIGIPDLMLHTPESKMSQHEWTEYTQHSVRGQTAVEGIDELREAGTLIRHHHERYDGTGFPDGLKKNDIPLGARLIALADFIDKELRRQEGGNALEKVCKMVEAESGQAFDPRLVPKVLKVAKKFYRENIQTKVSSEVEVSPNELAIGMVVSRDVLSGTGVLLLGQGTILNSKNIMTLKRYYTVDPANHGVFVSLSG
ncbi:MAG: response regulator [Proteobacteria bacterium]|nr:response regulator [Pseudomonadota bacterium]MBU1640465.1 response regulator [Pseudomonadota bacterium]